MLAFFHDRVQPRTPKASKGTTRHWSLAAQANVSPYGPFRYAQGSELSSSHSVHEANSVAPSPPRGLGPDSILSIKQKRRLAASDFSQVKKGMFVRSPPASQGCSRTLRAYGFAVSSLFSFTHSVHKKNNAAPSSRVRSLIPHVIKKENHS